MNENKAILFISDSSCHPAESGAERVLIEQAKTLMAKGYDCVVLNRDKHSDKIREEEYAGLKIVSVGTQSSNKVLEWIKCLCLSKKGLKIVKKKYPAFKAVLYHQPLFSYCLFKSIVRFYPIAEKLYFLHSPMELEYFYQTGKSRHPFNRAIGRFYHYIEGHVLKQMDYVFFDSKYMNQVCLKQHKGLKNKKLKVVPLGVDLKKFNVKVDTASSRRTLGLSGKSAIVFTLRNLEPRMGIVELVQAWSEVVKVCPDACLIIGGYGTLKEVIQKKIRALRLEKTVLMLGKIQESQLSAYFQAADVFVLPTQDLEGFGLVILEALACGTPVLGAPVGAIPETVSRFDPDLLMPSAEKKDMEKAIIEFLKTKRWLKYPPVRCRSFVQENYSWDRHVDEILKLLDA